MARLEKLNQKYLGVMGVAGAYVLRGLFNVGPDGEAVGPIVSVGVFHLDSTEPISTHASEAEAHAAAASAALAATAAALSVDPMTMHAWPDTGST